MARWKKLMQVAGQTARWGGLIFAVGMARAQDMAPPPIFAGHPVIVGALTCSTSSCHGGASEQSRQYVIWSQRDVHSRAYATLTTARAARMAEALGLKDPTTNLRCTTCHAPLQTVAPGLLAADARTTEGVSCASCHGPAEGWLRSHTRPDYTHADRVAAGLRDLHDLYTRANTCVACHQNIDPDLVATGRHPALLLELDGQTQSEPRHWTEPADRNGAQAWLVGQAVALREMSWALQRGGADIARETPRWRALVWLLQRTGLDYDLPALNRLADPASTDGLGRAIETADQLAQRAARTWSSGQTDGALAHLAATGGDFRAAGEATITQACRADRLVLALDRLLAALPPARRPAAASVQLDKLFGLVQSQPDFVPLEFARQLDVFAGLLEK